MLVRYGRLASIRMLFGAVMIGATAVIIVAVSPTMAQIRGAVRAVQASAPSHGPVAVDEATILARLAQAGFADISHLRRRGAHFTADARTRNGSRAKLVLHGMTGDILGLRLQPEVLSQSTGGS